MSPTTPRSSSSLSGGAPTSTPPGGGGDENLYKHYWELCTLSALHAGLRSGEIWVEGSRRYANPATYLISPQDWPSQRGEVLELTGMPATFAERLAAVDDEDGRALAERIAAFVVSVRGG